MPEIAKDVERLHVFQRSGNWFLPRRNRAYPKPVKAAIEHVPGLQAYRRRFIFNYGESLTAMIRHPRTLGLIGRARVDGVHALAAARPPGRAPQGVARLHVRVQAGALLPATGCPRCCDPTSSW